MKASKTKSYLKPVISRPWLCLSVAVAIAALVALAHWLHVEDYAAPEKLAALFDRMSDNPWMPIIIIGIYVVSGVFLFPVSVLSLATAMTYEPLMAVSISLTGAMLNAIVYYGGGYLLHLWGLRRAAKNFLPKIKKLLDRGGVAGVAVVHMVPVAPYSVVNLSLGIMAVPFVTYLLGTFIALLPGMVIRSFLGDALRDILERPDAQSIAYIIAGIAAWAVLIWITHVIARKWQQASLSQKKTAQIDARAQMRALPRSKKFPSPKGNHPHRAI